MMRVVVLALILLAAAATPAAAIDLRIAATARQGVPSDRTAPPAEAQASGVPALPQLVLRSRAAAGSREAGEAVDGPARLQPERRRQPASLLPWRGQGRSALALPLTDRLALGIGYRRVLGEDLWLEFAEIGAMDYESHNVLLRAHWRF